MDTSILNRDKFHRKAVQVADAQASLIPYMQQAEVETVHLMESLGRYLAEDVTSPHPFPHFRRSGMDGYAIYSGDTIGCSSEHPVWIEVVDEIPCGSLPSVVIQAGMAARIMTGAKVPDGADAVVMLEMVEVKESQGGTLIQVKREIEKGKNITEIGFELATDDLLLSKGSKISTGELSVLATFGISRVNVYKRPQIALFSTGSELLKVEEPLQDGKIRNSNTYMLASQVLEAGGEPIILDAIVDDIHVAKQKLEEAFKKYDIVITTGGVSVGDFDIMADIVREDEMTMLFNKVAMRPGSVTTAAVLEGKLLFALSGNPGACFVGFELFVRPTLGYMLSCNQPYLPEITATLGTDYDKINNFTRYVRGKMEVVNGQVIAYPASLDESNVMITIKDSNCLIVVPPTAQGMKQGEKVQVLILPGSTK